MKVQPVTGYDYSEVREVLEEAGKPMTVREIAEKIGRSSDIVGCAVNAGQSDGVLAWWSRGDRGAPRKWGLSSWGSEWSR